MKNCTQCHILLDCSMFAKRSASKDGLRPDCRLCQSKTRLRYAEGNRESLAQQQRDYYQTVKNHRKEYMVQYQSENRAKVNHHNAMRRAGCIQATPSWLTQEHKDQMEAMYGLCRDTCIATGEPHEVDHIIPLNGVNISGLHVPWNLQVLPLDLNRSKSNKHFE